MRLAITLTKIVEYDSRVNSAKQAEEVLDGLNHDDLDFYDIQSVQEYYSVGVIYPSKQ